jgi:hypothetical protein
MLKDFIKVNKMKAKIISFKRETSIQIAIFETKSSPSCAVKCEFFMDENSNEYLFVHSIESNLDIGKAKEVTGSLELFEKTDVETFELIGYEKPFLSPIGIYGVTICLDKPLTEKKRITL